MTKSLTKFQIKVLEDNDWSITHLPKFKMEFNSQFAGHMECDSISEAIEIYDDIIKHKETKKQIEEYRKSVVAREKKVTVNYIKSTVTDIMRVGITQTTLLNFFRAALIDIQKTKLTDQELTDLFTQVFDEEDPG